MKTIFFEWLDFEENIKNEYNINLVENSQYTTDIFDINKITDEEAISIGVWSRISNEDLNVLVSKGVKVISLRSTGFNMLDVNYAKSIGLKVYRVASYSVESIAEFAVALILTLARKLTIHRTNHQNFNNELGANLMGFTLKGKTIGIHGYGRIGRETANILRDGFKMKVLYFDTSFNGETVDTKVNSLEELYSQSDIVSIHVPLNENTRFSVNKDVLANVKENFMLINTARGEIVNSDDIIELLDQGKIAYLGVDVWGDKDEFDHRLLRDNTFQTKHSAFFTKEALKSIIEQTGDNLSETINPENIL